MATVTLLFFFTVNPAYVKGDMQCQSLVTGKKSLTNWKEKVLKTVLETIQCVMRYAMKIGKTVSVKGVAERNINVYASNFYLTNTFFLRIRCINSIGC